MRHNLSVKNESGYFPQLTLQRFSLKDKSRKRHSRFEQVNLLSRGDSVMRQNSAECNGKHPNSVSFKKNKHWHLQMHIYRFLEKPTGWLAGTYQIMM